ncbi:MAG: ATP-binding cassette domain-containing protein [Pseudoruegeria sp.]
MVQSRRNARPPKPNAALKGAFARLIPAIGLLTFFSIFINLFRLTIPLYMLQVIDRVISSESTETLMFITMFAVGALISGAFLTTISGIIQNRMGSWFEVHLFEPLAKATVLGQLTGRSNGVSSIRDLGQLRNFFSGPTLSTLFEVPWTPIFLGIIFIMHPMLGTISITVAILLLLIAILNDSLTSAPQQEAQQQQSITGRGLEQALFSVDSVRSMGMLNRLLTTLKDNSIKALDLLDRTNDRSDTLNNLSRFLRSLAQVSILGTGAYLILLGEITTGTMIASSILQSLGLSPVDKAVGALRSLKGARGAYTRVNQQMSAIDVTEDQLNVKPNMQMKVSARQAMFMPQGVNKPVLKPMQFDLPAGEMLGILGPGGSGKSILCRMLVGGLSPSNGSILINDLNINRVAGPELGALIGYMPQTATPLTGTIADNISRFHPASDPKRSAAIVEAAQAVDLHETVLGFRERYDTPLTQETLATLSRSQLQRIFLARAFYGNPRLVVLDEPTAYLDKTSEAALLATLERLRQSGCTIIASSQRPTLLNACDKLLLLRDGMVADFGPTERVMSNLSDPQAGRGQARLISPPQQHPRQIG